MAKSKKKQGSPPMKVTPKLYESEFLLADFVQSARAVFGVSPECVLTAFKMAGVDRATEKQAKKIVDDFMKQEVR